jgi:hypothetical protein
VEQGGKVSRKSAMTTSREEHDAQQEYPITVDHSRSLVDLLMSTGPTKRPSPEDVAEIGAKWPIDGSGPEERTTVIVRLHKYATTREAESEIARRGLRAARLDELLAFGERYPDVQDSFPVVALGSSHVDRLGVRRVPMLGTTQLMDDEELRHLMDVPADPGEQWADAGFLAVRE